MFPIRIHLYTINIEQIFNILVSFVDLNIIVPVLLIFKLFISAAFTVPSIPVNVLPCT